MYTKSFFLSHSLRHSFFFHLFELVLIVWQSVSINKTRTKITDERTQNKTKQSKDEKNPKHKNKSLTVWQNKYWMCICFIAWAFAFVLESTSTLLQQCDPQKKHCERTSELARAHSQYLLNTYNLIWNVELYYTHSHSLALPLSAHSICNAHTIQNTKYTNQR